MYFGAAWYPEHSPEARWEEDARLMREAGMNVCRVAEFAWSTLEPTENQYQLDWLERAVALLNEHGMAVVLGTPTAAPPAWLTHHHPDTVAIDANGRPVQHGNRCHVNPGSTTFIKYARRMAEQMAKRFGQDKRVIGWQIDNEYSRVDYSEATRRHFQIFLRERYGTLEALNDHWSTAYWSQTYTDWNEIPIPIGAHNPGLMLTFRHFVTEVWRDFQKMQIDAIRQHSASEQWITHNFMGWFDGFDHYKVSADLDFVSWDWYVGTGHHDYTKTGAAHDLARGFKRRNFWVMETQPGSVNWSGINNVLNKGEARCMAWHAIAHGADAILYWQWRSAPGGQEQLHGSLLGADGNPRPFYREAQQIGRDFQALGEALEGTTPHNDAAILTSYDSRWSLNAQRHHKEFDPTDHLLNYYRPLAARGVGVDILSAEAVLDHYKLVIVCAQVILTPETVANLKYYIESGGVVVFTVRCGQKDAHNALFPMLQPGPMRSLAGVEVEEFFALDEPVPVHAGWSGAQTGHSRIWAERLRPLELEGGRLRVLAHFRESNGWLDGGAAVTMNVVGEYGGRVVTVGAVLDEALQNSWTDWILAETGVVPVWPGLPEGVEAARRVGPGARAATLLINHGRTTVRVEPAASNTPRAFRDLLTGEPISGEIELPPYGVRVLVTSR